MITLYSQKLYSQKLRLASVAAFFAMPGLGQMQPDRGGGFDAAVHSPEVSPDRRITFRLRAPGASEVGIVGLVPGMRIAMEKDDSGLWSVTTDPMKPDIYSYSFFIDGAIVNDPGNPRVRSAPDQGGQSLVNVPGSAAWERTQGVPRGSVSHHFYRSSITGEGGDFFVYTPPGYDQSAKQPYPVLYLLHGLGDDASCWVNIGAADVILDNLIAQGKARPMLMVSLNANGIAGMAAGLTPGATTGRDETMPAFARALLGDVMPRVESLYRVSNERNDRAIAGVSMGGAEAVFIGLNNPEYFSWIASLSGAFTLLPGATPVGHGDRPDSRVGPGIVRAVSASVFENNFARVNEGTEPGIRLLWIGCGAEDALYFSNRQFIEWLKARNIAYTEVETPRMGHVWSLWRRNLTAIIPQLFRIDTVKGD